MRLAAKILLLAAAVAALTWPAWARERPPRGGDPRDATWDIYDEIASGPAD